MKDAQSKTKKTAPINIIAFLIAIMILPGSLIAQQIVNDTSAGYITLENCIQYALKHNPDLKNAVVNEAITETNIQSELSGWFPQVNVNYNLQHNFQLPTVFFNGNLTHSGITNTSGVNFAASQNIFNSALLLASRTAKSVRQQAHQTTSEQNINTAVLVSKAFYDLLLTEQQLKLTQEDIQRTEQSVKDAFYQYQAGIVDKTDYKRATIALNNAKAQKKTEEESLVAKAFYLKELMGYPADQNIKLVYDTAQMEKDIFIDTTQTINYNNRIEIRLLQTQKALQQYNLQYNKWAFLPDVSLFGNYNLTYFNTQLSKLYNAMYPNSYIGVLLSVPIFQGGKRLHDIRRAQLQITTVENSIVSTQNQINTQFNQAMSAYKSNFYDYVQLKENLALANEVYDVIRLQYRSGVKTYLDVITAETDLRTAQINYYNALYQLLSSKIDVNQALGNIVY
jgi:outer membrane protein